MSHTYTSASAGGSGLLVAVLFGVPLWFAGISALVFTGSFNVPVSEPLLPHILAAVLPPLLLIIGLVALPGLQQAVVAIDPAVLIMLQAWRIVGGMFLVLLALGLLPGSFAWPAGIGDAAIGAAAPFVALQLARGRWHPGSIPVVLLNLLGLLDLAIAMVTGSAGRSEIPVSTELMGQVPLIFILVFAVPLFAMIHIVSLAQAVIGRRA